MKTNLIRRIILGVVIILLAGVSALQMIPPRAVSAEAPATRFSAERAMADLRVVAREPHNAGSDAQRLARDYIVGEVEKLGLRAEIETSGSLENILVRMLGTDNTKTVLVSGHYDSTSLGPGAGDDGVSVVAMLESLRVLRANPTLRNDIVFLFTDGEELGWKGAKAFVNAHPEAKDETGMLLVFDARPGNAPLSLIKTSPGDAWILRRMTGLPLAMWAASWKNLQERNELDTDYDVFQPAGYTGIVMENEVNGTRYHTDRDTAEAISPHLVQAYGQTMLTLINRFGDIDLRLRTEGGDLVFFTLSLVGLVAYPYWVMISLSCLGIVALLVLVIIEWLGAHFSMRRFLLGLLGYLIGIVFIVLVAQLAWGVIKSDHAMDVAAFGSFEGSAAWQVVLMGGASVLMIVFLTLLSRRFGWFHMATTAAISLLIAGFAINSLTKTDNPLTTAWLAWSFLGSVAGIGVMLIIKNPIWRAVGLALSALLVVAVAVPRIWMASYTREGAWLTAMVVCIWMGLFTPQVEAIFGREPARVDVKQLTAPLQRQSGDSAVKA